MFRSACCLLFFLLALSIAQGQHYNNWVFGSNVQVSFNPPAPLPRFVDGSAMVTTEGCGSISDSTGRLLFYTNGYKIYDRRHEVMQNGDSILGHSSAYQGAVILKQPGSNDLYYVFTTDAYEHNFTNSYRYSVVDMRLNNGFGAVIRKNVLLFDPASERLTAAYHANGKDIWVLTNERSSNRFQAWLLSCTGLSASPVLSQAGEIFPENEMNVGAMKISPDGRYLCQTHFPLNSVAGIRTNFFQLFRFDASTGRVSEGKKILIPGTDAYSCEFSPNSRFLYVTNPGSDSLYQFESFHPTASATLASLERIPAIPRLTGIQLGPDRKIYITNSTAFLSQLRLPDNRGAAASFQPNTVSLESRNGYMGLPFVLNDPDSGASYFSQQVIDSCRGIVQFTGHTDLSGPISWLWEFGDGTTSSEATPTHQYQPSNGQYQVRLTIRSSTSCASIVRARMIEPQGVAIRAFFEADVDCASREVRFRNRSDYAGTAPFRWLYGDGGQSNLPDPAPYTYPGQGPYTAQLILYNSGLCGNDTFSRVINLRPPFVQMPPARTILEGETVSLSPASDGVRFFWTPSAHLSHPASLNTRARPDTTTVFQLTAFNGSGCRAEGSVEIRVQYYSDIFIPTAFTPNRDGLNDVFTPVVGRQFILERFLVFDRWGQPVFSTLVAGQGWDGRRRGKDQPSGTYVWMLDGRTLDGRIIRRNGTVALIR